MYIAILGRQPAIGIAELESLFGDVRWFSDQSALVNTTTISVERLGGSLKIGRVVAELPRGDWRQASMKLVKAYAEAWSSNRGKVTLGISAYGFDVSARDVQKTGLVLKSKLKNTGVSLRLVPNTEPALNTATSHHNKLGLSSNKVELLVVRARNGRIIIAESTGAQNITQLARRDHERPKRDAFVGMLPPKLAQIMVNLTVISQTAEKQSSRSTTLQRETKSEEQPEKVLTKSVTFSERNGLSAKSSRRGEQENGKRLLDPFCGTGVLLQEALLLGYDVYGTDLSDKMVEYSQANLAWIKELAHTEGEYEVHQGDAMNTTWHQPIDAVACETYLGQPFSAPPSSIKLTEVRGNCDHIITQFLKNISTQITSGTPLCIAVPAWKSTDGSFTHLSLIGKLAQLGYEHVGFKNIRTTDLLYYRDDQVVARELLVLKKI